MLMAFLGFDSVELTMRRARVYERASAISLSLSLSFSLECLIALPLPVPSSFSFFLSFFLSFPTAAPELAYEKCTLKSSYIEIRHGARQRHLWSVGRKTAISGRPWAPFGPGVRQGCFSEFSRGHRAAANERGRRPSRDVRAFQPGVSPSCMANFAVAKRAGYFSPFSIACSCGKIGKKPLGAVQPIRKPSSGIT